VWDVIYRSEPDRGGLVGALTARARPQMLRLAVIYAILDEADEIEPAHLHAAAACWRYSVATVEHVFGSLRGDTVQDRLLLALRDVYPHGLTGAEQDALFGKSLRAGRLLSARQTLERNGLVRTERSAPGEKGGRRKSSPSPFRTERARINPDQPHRGRLIRVFPLLSEEKSALTELAFDSDRGSATSIRERPEKPGLTSRTATE
jgi:hypothetical protein